MYICKSERKGIMEKIELIRKLERAKRTLLKHQMDVENTRQRIEKYRRELQQIELTEKNNDFIFD